MPSQRIRPAKQSQVPPVHASPSAQTLLHVPQWRRLVIVSVQREGPPPTAHAVRPVPQVVQRPPAQTPSVPQLLRQAPQFAASVIRSTHAPLHGVVVGPQPQRPSVQTAPAAQRTPQRPQFAASVIRSAHTCSPSVTQTSCPASVQLTMHSPIEHIWVPSHATSHAPQWS
jgi:hypothetical protein